jgi:flagellar protein FliO/FliZ
MSRSCSTMHTCGRVGLVCWYSLFPMISTSIAADATPVVAAGPSFVSLLQVMFGLGVVLAAIAGSAWLLKRLGPGQVAAAGALRVVGGVAIGHKERVVLVDVGDTRLVLGVAPGHITTLHQMPRPIDEPEAPAKEPLASLFQEKLKGLLNKSGGGQSVD